MINEEKIITMFETLIKGQSETNQRLDKLEDMQSGTNQRLDKLEATVSEVQKGQSETNKRLDKLEGTVSELKTEVKDTRERVTNIETEVQDTRERVILIENEHGQYLRALGDGFTLMSNKLEPIPTAALDLQKEVAVLNAVVSSHARIVQAVKSAV